MPGFTHWLRLAVLSAALAMAWPVAGQAQDPAASVDFAQWDAVASRAEAATEDGRASEEALDALRAEIVAWRDQFLAAQKANGTRIETLKEQIAALGPPPAEGEAEAPELAERRAALQEQLAAIEAPRRTADEAYRRADGLVREIDALIRERQARVLLELGPTPIDPTIWGEALRRARDTVRLSALEVGTALRSEAKSAEAIRTLPASLVLLAVGLVLLTRGGRWMAGLAARMNAHVTSPRGRLAGFLGSLGEFVLPLLGLIALARAADVTGLAGFRTSILIDNLVPLGAAILAVRWLGRRLFSVPPPVQSWWVAPSGSEAGARRALNATALIWAASLLLRHYAAYEDYSAEVRAVLFFPLILGAAYFLWRLARVIGGRSPAQEGAPERVLKVRLPQFVGRALVAVSVLAPLVAAVGYLTAGLALIFPSFLTVVLFGAVIVVSSVMRDLYAYLTDQDDEAARNALAPVLLSLVVILASLPVLALIWGARVSDLTELWARFREGFRIGESRISPTDFLTFLVVFAAGYALTRVLQLALRTSVLPRTRLDQGARNAMVSGVGYVGIFLAAVIAISSAGIDLSNLALVAGALSVGIGFGLQNIVSNFVSGIILLIERPIAEGDWIEVGGKMGYVRDISVRSTRIETFDRTDVIVPNADLVSGPVTNYTRGNLIGRVILSVGVAYGSDTRKVEAILREVASDHPGIMTKPVGVHFVRFGADALEFEIRIILTDVNRILEVTSDVNHAIARRFREEGIEIPFAQRDIWLRNPEALRAAQAAAQEGEGS